MYDEISLEQLSVPNQESYITTTTVSETLNDKVTAPIELLQDEASASNNDPVSIEYYEEVTLQETLSLKSAGREDCNVDKKIESKSSSTTEQALMCNSCEKQPTTGGDS